MSVRIATLYLILTCSTISHADHRYSSYESLARHEKEGVDYRVVQVNHPDVSVTVFAIHGGLIESGSSEVAQALSARAGYNLYMFEGIKAQHNEYLHITSHHFNEPRALERAAQSQLCLSMHGFTEMSGSVACIGGGNLAFRQKVYQEIVKRNLPFRLSFPCELFPGAHPQNIVNRCAQQGVQIEMSLPLRDQLKSDAVLRVQFVDALKSAVDSMSLSCAQGLFDSWVAQ